MTELCIGTGGWAYFNVPKINSLVAYSKAFNFVEVNSTFYQVPKLNRVKYWRKIVPNNFEFSVRCNKRLTHELEFDSIPETYIVLNKMVEICSLLKAEILHFQTSPYFNYNKLNCQKIQDFFSSIEKINLRFAWEARSPIPLNSSFMKILEDLEIIHCVDLLKGSEPVYGSDIIYTRLFGKGFHNVYQPLDGELKQIIKQVSKEEIKKAVIVMHSNKMFKDAARLKVYKESGIFPRVTKSTGLDSLIEVLKEDTIFPINKKDLINHQGWKIFDKTLKVRIRASNVLEKLSEKSYYEIDDIIQELRGTNVG